MKRHSLKLFASSLAISAFIAATPLAAQAQTTPPQPSRSTPTNGNSPAVNILNAAPGDKQPDVVLDIPDLSVEEINLEVKGLEAHVALDAQLASLLHLTAGADARLDSVKIGIKGVHAQAALIVRLDNVRAIIERTLQTLDKNPAIITQVTGTLNNAVGVAGGVVNNTVNTVGDLTKSVLRSGAVLDVARSGLSVVNQTVNSAGQTVQRLRANDGTLYDVVTDTAGRITSSTRVSS